MRNSRPSIALGLLATLSLGSCLYEADNPDLTGQDVRLTILHTSDVHSRILPYDHVPLYTEQQLGLAKGRGPYGGVARMAHIVKREREHAGRSIWVDSGDLFQGAPIFNIFNGEAEVRAMSMAGLDAMALGNHEFDHGPENVLEQFSSFGDFDLLAANYEFEDDAKPFATKFDIIVKPFVVYNVDGLKLGIIGMGNLSSMNSLEDGTNNLGVLPKETLQTVQFYTNFLRESVDLVVLLDHLGLTEDEVLARNICGLDLILGGHHHIALSPPKLIDYNPDAKYISARPDMDAEVVTVDSEGEEDDPEAGADPDGKDPPRGIGECKPEHRRQTLLAHPNAFAKFVSRLDIVVRDKHIISHKFKLFPIDATVPEDPETREVLQEYINEMAQTLLLDRVITTATESLRRFGNTGGDSMLGNLVAEAMQYRRYIETEFCVTNSLGIRTDILAGPITYEQMYNVMPFENTITTMILSGLEVQELLDFATRSSAERGCNSQIQVSGISFTMNCRTGKAEDIKINGEPLKSARAYDMCTNDYMAWGGSGFRMLKRNTTKVNTGIPIREAMIQYMRDIPQLPACYDTNTPLDLCKSGYAVPDGRIVTKY
ncbi:bifunctional metallophosphatase/5'-nucleotidase [Nannocystis bainbridge]|uniref:Bifunctional UDP-sugar hydrolase/5'-nucleotidase n=1 Tax=Nannocystis bainbridge TaxID=2995303 RepID=A0ABT5EAL2_9BACT|nr:bifunctional UDP-sugar hydrolase/5'-nucleotidase [Nannocystis bainbridge]MDC0722891.1 bifunctional UDP-sugar hydrolase/5'-nucleotidase [Nannocystis bainbridge]